MSKLGLGVMINLLSGSYAESVGVFRQNIDKKIADLEISEEELIFTFTDGTRMKMFDDGQSCCETRYMHTDDDLKYFVGAQLWNAEVREGPAKQVEWGEEEETQFLVITTSKGQFTVVNYNIHNGYYGGFDIKAVMVA